MGYTFPNKNKFKFYFDQKRYLKFKPHIKPSDWINKNFYLGKGYVVQGKLTLMKFQELIVDLCLKYNCVYLVGPTQTGKSLLLETIVAYLTDNKPAHMMIVYETEVKSKSVFRDRLKPMIKDNKEILKYWSGSEDDLTDRKITLNHMIMRIGHGGVRSKNSISSFAAPIVVADELAKWPKITGFNQIEALHNRTESGKMVGLETFVYACTSPLDTEDIAYKECHKNETLFHRFFFVCPHCKDEIQLVDRYIKEIPNKNNEFDHDPDRILREKAAYIECPSCLGTITEDQRRKMIRSPRLLPVDKKDKLKQIKVKRKFNEIAINWNRLIFPYYSIYTCLASFFKAQNSGDRSKMDTYINETMAEWINRDTKMIDKSFLKSKTTKYSYKQLTINSKFPSFVKILIAGIDTQDNGFYLVVRGYGLGMESILVREKFIKCPMTKQKNEDVEKAFEMFYDGLYKRPFIREDGQELAISFGFIDRGGHRAALVDYICLRLPWLNSYIGATAEAAPLIVQSKKGNWYLGNTKALSRIVHGRFQSDYFHLPKDYSLEYSNQVLNQYDEQYIDTKGNQQTRWISKDPDHFRDGENLCEAMVNLKNIQRYAFSEDYLEELESNTKNTIKKLNYEDIKRIDSENQNIIQSYTNEMSNMGW